MSGHNNTQKHKLVQAVELLDTEMEKVSGGGCCKKYKKYDKKGCYSYKGYYKGYVCY